MPKMMSFTTWLFHNRRRTFKTPEEAIRLYIDKVLLLPKQFNRRYSRQQATDDIYEALTRALDATAGSIDLKLSGRRVSGTNRGNAKPLPPVLPWWWDTGALEDEAEDEVEDGEGGKKDVPGTRGGKSVSVSNAKSGGKSGGSTLTQSDDPAEDKTNTPKQELEAYDNKAEFGDLELRKLLTALPRNPDVVIKDGDKDLKDDRNMLGVVRLAPAFTSEKRNIAEFKAAPGGTPWLGFVRIGRRVDLGEDRLVLIQLCDVVETGRQYALAHRGLRAGTSWHGTLLDTQPATLKESRVKKWNGWAVDELAKDKNRSWVATGCYFGFFLVKGSGGGKRHYLNFRCASLNAPANSYYTDFLPDLARAKMNPPQIHALLNLTEAARANFDADLAELKSAFPGVPLKRGALGTEHASAKLPRVWAKAVVDEIRKW